MKTKILTLCISLFLVNWTRAQETEIDTLNIIPMKEVIVIGNKKDVSRKENKSLATLDEYLEKSAKISMIKRGAYAWEPMINGMATERTVITIDGMRIFSACTDKMDPVTSYVEISNLQEASISSGQEGAEHGATIGGAVDMKIHKTGFSPSGWKVEVNSGLETNGEQKIAGAKVDYSQEDFFFNADFMHRDAENYHAGGGKEVLYSRFTKYNFSAVSGYRLSRHQSIEAAVILDKATDIGYPALPMDVSLAKAAIGSLKYEFHKPHPLLDHWETKVYFNTITHIMDDAQREDVAMRMNMPGWSDTYGFYSKGNSTVGKHRIKINLNSFYNKSLAEMTMFPNDPTEMEMFMLTWPDVRTFYNGFFLEDQILLSEHLNLKITGSLGSHNNSVQSEQGLQSLKIFYPEMKESKHRILAGASTRLQLHKGKMNYSLGTGYGERAPSVSEAYGFYLFNSFNGYDFIGNPGMDTERSMELNSSVAFKNKFWSAKLSGSYFHIQDYIIGIPDPDLTAMTIGANGVMVYSQLPYATFFNTDLSLEVFPYKNWHINTKLIYNHGRDHKNRNLPLVQPLSYFAALGYSKGLFSIEGSIEGAMEQSNFSTGFGENRTPAYTVVNLSASRSLYLNNQRVTVKAGAENLFDTYYSTFSDWNNIPRRGRNIFVNLNYAVF
ncbi:TonB-dependent receptor [Antarcticibacterium flavum]|uniref:TonB-dependent receptor n=1 Tax=Antarcticibacterium flavum TaxID=2058175 RepID=A0A5B7X579_9FLAO|nr:MULTISPECIES: TonB-dependent receptor [Antarcticibacterium]MCM4159695.1 TonB-dependent receptor [Antarcticibacterium sp. W02-3]QCY70634.1 TonB-dependent receptor [Antarcticibacterium flavum]